MGAAFFIMATVSLQQTDTAAVDGSIQACATFTIAASIQDARTATQGGTAGGSHTVTIQAANGGSSKRAIQAETASGEIDNYSILAGNWVDRLNITAIGSDVTWVSTHICRVNSSGVSQGTIGSLLNQSISGTGVKTMTISGSASTAQPGDRIVIIRSFKNSSGASDESVSYIADQLIDTPMTSGPGVQFVAKRRVAHYPKVPLVPISLRGQNKHHRTPFVSVTPTPGGAWVRYETRQAKHLPPFPYWILRGRSKRHKPLFLTSSSSTGVAIIKRHRQGQWRHRYEPIRGKPKRRRFVQLSTTPPAAGAFVRFVHRLAKKQVRYPEPLRGSRRRRKTPPPTGSQPVVRRHRQYDGWLMGSEPKRGSKKRRRVPFAATAPPPSGLFVRLRRRVGDGNPWFFNAPRKRRCRVPFVAAAPPPAGAFVRWIKRLAKKGPFAPLLIKGKARRSRVIRPFGAAQIVKRHRQVGSWNRLRAEPLRGLAKRRRVPGQARFAWRLHRVRRLPLPIPATLFGKVRRHRLPGSALPSQIPARKRRPTRWASLWRPPYSDSTRRKVPKIGVALATVIRRHRQGKFYLPAFKGKVRREKFYTLISVSVPNPVIKRHRKTDTLRSLEPGRGKAKRRRLPQIPSRFRVLRHRLSAPIVRWLIPRPIWKRRRLPGLPAVLATVIRGRKRLLAKLLLPRILAGKYRRGRHFTLVTIVVSNPVNRRHRDGAIPGLGMQPARGNPKRRRVPQPAIGPKPTRHRIADGWFQSLQTLWRWITRRRKNFRTGQTPPTITPQPDIIVTGPEANRVWLEPGRSKTYKEPRHPRVWREPRRFVSGLPSGKVQQVIVAGTISSGIDASAINASAFN